jgi:hypothetical protein
MENVFSITDSFDAPWSQHTALPSLQRRESLTPTSQPTTDSQPSADTQPAAITVPTAAPRSQSKPKHLTDNERLILLRLAIQSRDLYGHVSSKSFWRSVSRSFKEHIGREHGTLARTVATMVKARQAALAEDPSGEEARSTSYTDAIDEWISIVDEQKAVEQARKDAQGTRDGETQESLAWRAGALSTWVEKDRLGQLARGQKRHRAASQPGENNEDDADAESNQEDDAFELTPATRVNTPQPGRKRRRSTKTPGYDEDDLPRHVGRLVDIFAARSEQHVDTSGVDDLKAEVSGLKDKLDNMETDMKDILSLLRRQHE